MAKFVDQTITFTFDELEILRNAVVAYEDKTEKFVDTVYDKIEHGIHESLNERIQVVKKVCNDCEFNGTSMCPITNGVYECQLREDNVEEYRKNC